MTGNSRAGRKKVCVARKPGIIFQSPEFFKNKSDFLYGYFYVFPQMYASTESKFRQKLDFMMPNIKI